MKSKAQQYVGALRNLPRPPSINISKKPGSFDITRLTGYVTGRGGCRINMIADEITEAEALQLANWIIDTFGEEE
jgi:hypothetical protein